MPSDPADIVARIKAVLPGRWFGDETPNLDALLTGLAQAWVFLLGLIDYARLQTRISTATGEWLDRVSQDFFGSRLPRRATDTDDVFRRRILAELRRSRGTRSALEAALMDLTGRAPRIFEPARPADTGAWTIGLGYCVAGGWGSLTMPFELFVTAFRPSSSRPASVPGWGAGAWNVGASAYGTPDTIFAQPTDADIYAAVAAVLPVSCTAWTSISN